MRSLFNISFPRPTDRYLGVSATAAIVLLFVLALSACDENPSTSKKSRNYTVVLSMDGFRSDYTELTSTPHLNALADRGVRSSLIPVFPSKTFVNHYSMATGLYPGNHGIVLNDFYDYRLQRWYRVSDRESVQDGSLYQGEPIWNTAEKQGLRAACFFWVGSEADVQDMHPSTYKIYEHALPFTDRIDSVLSWLRKPVSDRPRLIMWYLHQPDSWGHRLGPEHPEMPGRIAFLDSLMGIYFEGIASLSIADSINLIISSDHGMQQLSSERSLIIEDFLDLNRITRYSGSDPVYMFEPEPDYLEEAYRKLGSSPHLSVWKREDLPQHFRLYHPDRLMPLIAVADSAWSLRSSANLIQNDYPGGTHGYDPASNKNMHALFIAAGPDFETGIQFPPFSNTRLYALIAELLGLSPAEGTGELGDLRQILRR